MLTGSKANLVGEKGKGVKTIATLFNITRIYNTISAVSYMRRAYSLSKAYSSQREAFGQKIENHLLHKRTLREMEIAYQSNTMLGLFLAKLLGKEDCNTANENDKSLLRLLTPVAKLYTAKNAIKYASEHIETFGGVGYLEDSGIPVMLRDAQVLSIWEGTTNVLSLDMLRAIEKENGLVAFAKFADELLANISIPELSAQKGIVEQKVKALFSFAQNLKTQDAMIASSRDFAFYLAETAIALLWLDFLKGNLNKSNYKQTLNYWLEYKMSEKKLRMSDFLSSAE
jgi:hypothetical protein